MVKSKVIMLLNLTILKKTFSVPSYKSGDTVRVKFYMTEGNMKLIDNTLNASISFGKKELTFKNIKPLYKGAGYDIEFVLHDSLDFRIDNTYYLYINSNKDESDLYIPIKVEEYELNSTVLEIKNSGNIHYFHTPHFITFSAKDNNDLPIYDAKAKIEIFIDDVKNINQFKKNLLLKNWFH